MDRLRPTYHKEGLLDQLLFDDEEMSIQIETLNVLAK